MTRHLELGRRAEDRAADHIEKSLGWKLLGRNIVSPYGEAERSEERRVGKECRSRWSPYH